MNDNSKKEGFRYTYSAEKQREAEKILQRYTEHEESPLDEMRRIDREACMPGSIASISTGIIGILIMGGGMSLVMEFENCFAIGIALSLVGMAAAALAFPIYKIITERRRKKAAPRIIELSERIE